MQMRSCISKQNEQKNTDNVHAAPVEMVCNKCMWTVSVYLYFCIFYNSSPRSKCECNKFNITTIKEHTIIRM